MAVSSLPSPYGIGTLGKAAYDFADFLKDAGQSYWQMLPLGPTSYGDSPYQSFSAYAGNPYYIDPDMLAADGLLTDAECAAPDWGSDPRHVDYGKIYESRFTLLHKAYKRGWERDAEAVAAFAQDNARWLPDYALYMACKRHFGMKAWTEWPDDDLRLRKNEAVLDKYRTLLREDVQFFTYLQFLFSGSGPLCATTSTSRASASSAICPSTWPWTPPTSGLSRSSSSWTTIWCPRLWPASRRITLPPTASCGATPSTTGTPCVTTASAGGSAGSTAPASCMM